MRCLEILQTAIPIAGRRTTVDKNVGATDEAAAARHEKFGEVTNLVGSTGAMSGTGCYHVEIAFGAWAVQLVIGQRSDDDAR